MEYTIQELARLAGVTPRTLRWYDQIGLLKPSRVADSGYRYYGPAEVDRLQDILYHRALGFSLDRIKACLDDPAFHRLTALRSHLADLEARQLALAALIRSVRETIRHEERKDTMLDEQKFAAFKDRVAAWQEETYGEDFCRRYGPAAAEQARSAVADLTPEQYRAWTDLGEKLRRQLETAVQAGALSEGEQGRAVTAGHRQWLTMGGGAYDPAKHKELARHYTDDEGFLAYYDRHVSGCARFLRDAILHWA